RPGVPARRARSRQGGGRRSRAVEDRLHARRVGAGRGSRGACAAGVRGAAGARGSRTPHRQARNCPSPPRIMTPDGVGADLVIQAPHVLREDLEILRLMTGAQGVEPIGRAACDAYRLHEPQDRAGVSEACAAAHYDYAFVPHQRALDRVRLVAMHGIGDDVAAITAAAMRGEIDFRASLTRRVALLEGLPIDALARVYDERLRLSPGAPRLFEALQAIGAKTLLVSGGFTFFTERLQARLGIDFTL